MKVSEQIEQLIEYQTARLQHCELCLNWFLGCLNGRKKWEDKAITPNKRFIGKSGAEYSFSTDGEPPEHEYPLRMCCDAFVWDPDPDRLGRIIG